VDGLLTNFTILIPLDYHFTGGISPQRDTNEKARLLKIVRDNLCSFEGCWELHKVESITKQVVAGKLSTVHGIFEEVMEEAFYKGAVKIWEKPWMKFIEGNFSILNTYIFKKYFKTNCQKYFLKNNDQIIFKT